MNKREEARLAKLAQKNAAKPVKPRDERAQSADEVAQSLTRKLADEDGVPGVLGYDYWSLPGMPEAMRPVLGLSKGREVSLCKVAQASASISDFSVVLSA